MAESHSVVQRRGKGKEGPEGDVQRSMDSECTYVLVVQLRQGMDMVAG